MVDKLLIRGILFLKIIISKCLKIFKIQQLLLITQDHKLQQVNQKDNLINKKEIRNHYFKLNKILFKTPKFWIKEKVKN